MRITSTKTRPNRFSNASRFMAGFVGLAAGLALCLSVSSGAVPMHVFHRPIPFLLEKAKGHDVLFLGTTHQQEKILGFLSRLIPRLPDAGVTHVGLEIATDQQFLLEQFVANGTDLHSIEIFKGIDCPEYRYLLRALRASALSPVALDLPKSMWQMGYTRDEWMARRIQKILIEQPEAKILVIVGNLHVLKRVEWWNPEIKDRFVPAHLSALMPDRTLFSVAECIEQVEPSCLFQVDVPAIEKPFGFETVTVDHPLWLSRYIAAKPLPARQSVDAVIVH